MIKKICIKCNKEYFVKPYMQDKSKYCSRKCQDNGQRIKKGKYIKCFTCEKEIYKQKHKLKGRCYCSRYCMNNSPYKKEISSNWMKKLNKNILIRNKIIKSRLINNKKNNWHPKNYIDGSSRLRYNDFQEWIKIAKECYKRDNWTCQTCGKHGGIIHAHHKIPFSISKDNSLDNLITLCIVCHARLHNKLRRKEC